MTTPISIGDFQLTNISGGRLRVDGGNMFGVIPRAMWERVSPPDELNRIQLETNCVVVRTPNSLGLVDTGSGSKASPKYRQRHALEDGAPLLRNLASIGVAPEEIDWVILTHLHADHAGGATFRDEDGRPQPTFRRARNFIQRIEWDDAIGQLPELEGAYYPDDFAPLERAGLVEIVDGDAEIAPGIVTQLTGGHTRGHQIVRFESGRDSAVCLADLVPTTAHLPTLWTMSYDQFPLDVRRIKPLILRELVDRHRIALFSHDPDIAAARLSLDPDDKWVATRVVSS
jgi:glyoxylase-like metal-dependent hydrolase (beta-lactamase superfamily II)